MALRSRPLKFSILQATHLQKRSCRSHIERRVADYGVLEKRHSLPQVLTQCITCTPAGKQKPFQDSVKKSTDEGEFDSIRVPFYCKDIHLQIWKDQPLGLRHVVSSDVIVSAHHHGNQAFCDNSSENYSMACNARWPYSKHDILFGAHDISMKSAAARADPAIAEEFFEHNWASAPVVVKHKKMSDNKASEILSPSNELNPIFPMCVESDTLDSDLYMESSVASDFMYFMEYFMNGTFALEKNEQVECSPAMVTPDVVDHRCVTSEHVNREIPGVVYYGDFPGESTEPKKPLPDRDRPGLQQLENMREYFTEMIPRFFVKRLDYSIYTEDLIFENNYFVNPYVTTGLKNYAVQVAKLRLLAHFRFANVRIHILKITVHEEDGSVRIRWRLSGIPQSRAFMFWKFLPWRYTKKLDTESEWHDGFSTFYLNKAGFIIKHRMDIVMPEEEPVVRKKPSLTETLNHGLAA